MRTSSEFPFRKVPSQLKPAARAAREAGWAIFRTGGGHLKWKPPEGRFIITPSTPSDARSQKNSLADLRAAGLRW